MATLPFDTLELVSCTRTVPRNGSPTSQDYNDTQGENLIDHAAIADAINTLIRPVLMQLSSDAASRGVIGDTVFTDTSDLTALCFNSHSNQALTVKESLQYLQAILNALQIQVGGINTQVSVISSQLSATNQNSIALSLQNFQTALNQQANSITALQNTASTHAFTTFQHTTGSIAASGKSTVACYWPTAQENDTYTVSCSVQDATGFLQVDSWTYITGGQGITVTVANSDGASAHTGTLHLCAIS